MPTLAHARIQIGQHTPHRHARACTYLPPAANLQMPVPITDSATLARIHQNYAIAFLAEATIPLALEGGGAALLSCMQQVPPPSTHLPSPALPRTRRSVHRRCTA